MIDFQTYNKAGKRQTLSLVMFVLSSLWTAASICLGLHFAATLGGSVMIANLTSLQVNNRIIERHIRGF
jgi:hypothetical protein